MIAVKSIEVVEIPEDILNYHPSDQRIASFDPRSANPHQRVMEMIQGRRFVNARGEKFCIGMSKEVEKAIGLPFEAFENMSNSLEDWRLKHNDQVREINRYQGFISELGRAGFLKRLKYLFTGYKFEQNN